MIHPHPPVCFHLFQTCTLTELDSGAAVSTSDIDLQWGFSPPPQSLALSTQPRKSLLIEAPCEKKAWAFCHLRFIRRIRLRNWEMQHLSNLKRENELISTSRSLQASVSLRAGCAMGTLTVRTDRMKNPVSRRSVSHPSTPVRTTPLSAWLLTRSAMAKWTVPTARMKDPSVVMSHLPSCKI